MNFLFLFYMVTTSSCVVGISLLAKIMSTVLRKYLRLLVVTLVDLDGFCESMLFGQHLRVLMSGFLVPRTTKR